MNYKQKQYMSKTMICPYCGGNLSNQGEDFACNVKLEYQNSPNAKVHYLMCVQCGKDYEVYDPKENGTA